MSRAAGCFSQERALNAFVAGRAGEVGGASGGGWGRRIGALTVGGNTSDVAAEAIRQSRHARMDSVSPATPQRPPSKEPQ